MIDLLLVVHHEDDMGPTKQAGAVSALNHIESTHVRRSNMASTTRSGSAGLRWDSPFVRILVPNPVHSRAHCVQYLTPHSHFQCATAEVRWGLLVSTLMAVLQAPLRGEVELASFQKGLTMR